MRYVILGAGAVGATIGARLFQAGHDVVLIARGPHAKVMKSKGLTLQRPQRTDILNVAVVSSPVEANIQTSDVVVLSTKTQDSQAALDTLVSAAPAGVPLICTQNGVESERLALRHFDRVYAMCVMLPATYLEPGLIRSFGVPRPGILDIGCYPTGVDEMAGRVAADLETADFSSQAVAEVMRLKYRKLLVNVRNAVEAMCGPPGWTCELTERALIEAESVLALAGLDVATEEEHQARRAGVMQVAEITGVARGGSTSWQSLARGTGSIETDYLNGEIALVARLHRLASPINAALQREARWFAEAKLAPGAISVEELTRRVEELIADRPSSS